MVLRWRADDNPTLNNIECWLSIFVIFQGILTSIAKKPYIFVIFRGWGGGGGLDPPLHPHINKDLHVYSHFLKLHEFALGGRVDAKTLTKITDCHVGGHFSLKCSKSVWL